MIEKIEKAILKLRDEKPVVLNLTNFVTMDIVANSLLALGAAPIMSVCDEEMEELIAISSVLYINIGTLDERFNVQCKRAVEIARTLKKPIVLDPVGAGATKCRTELSKYLMQFADIVRGNASEIMALAGAAATTKGVESAHSVDDARDIAVNIAKMYKNTVVISGEVDFVTDGVRSASYSYGSHLMQNITGMGCSVTAVIAAFRAVLSDSYEAATFASLYFALCGDIAAKQAKAPGSFRLHFIDQLYEANLTAMKEVYDQ